jgi:hypothetical protein
MTKISLKTALPLRTSFPVDMHPLYPGCPHTLRYFAFFEGRVAGVDVAFTFDWQGVVAFDSVDVELIPFLISIKY